MDVASLLKTLGIDSTLYYQLAIFIMAYVPLHFLLFKPYFKAYKERMARTEGNQQASERLLIEAEELRIEYENKARQLNENFKAIYNESRTQVLKEFDHITAEAREKAKAHLESSKTKIQKEFLRAQGEVQKDIPKISSDIVGQMLH